MWNLSAPEAYRCDLSEDLRSLTLHILNWRQKVDRRAQDNCNDAYWETEIVYIIDGNNVIGGRVGWHRDKPGSRRLLMQDLARLARTKKLRLNVVFDGAPDPQFPDGSSYRGVGIFYSRQGSDADARIIEMVEAERNKKSLVVVTSDGKLISRVRACGARIMRSGEFRRMLDEVVENAEAVENAPDQEPDAPDIKDDEMNEWLRYFGVEESEGA